LKKILYNKSLFETHVHIHENGCWIWQRAKTKAGYGQLSVQGKVYYAHRLAYMLYHGSYRDNLRVLHTCDTPACVNPQHLFLGTQKDNMHDAQRKGRAIKPPIHSGEHHHFAKITEVQAQSIRQEYTIAKTSQRKLAKEYGLNQKTIFDIIHHHIWK
jgi:hypothetical protein